MTRSVSPLKIALAFVAMVLLLGIAYSVMRSIPLPHIAPGNTTVTSSVSLPTKLYRATLPPLNTLLDKTSAVYANGTITLTPGGTPLLVKFSPPLPAAPSEGSHLNRTHSQTRAANESSCTGVECSRRQCESATTTSRGSHRPCSCPHGCCPHSRMWRKGQFFEVKASGPLRYVIRKLLSTPLPPEEYDVAVSLANAFITAQNCTGVKKYSFIVPNTNKTMYLKLPEYGLSNVTIPYPPTARVRNYVYHWVSSYTLVYATSDIHYYYEGSTLYIHARNYLVVETSTTSGLTEKRIYCGDVDRPVGYGFDYDFGYFNGMGPIGRLEVVNNSGSVWAETLSRYIYFVGETYWFYPLVEVHNGKMPVFVDVRVQVNGKTHTYRYNLSKSRYNYYPYVCYMFTPFSFNVSSARKTDVKVWVNVTDHVVLGSFSVNRTYPLEYIHEVFSPGKGSLPPFGGMKFYRPSLKEKEILVNNSNITYPVKVVPSARTEGRFLTALYGREIAGAVKEFYRAFNGSYGVYELAAPLQLANDMNTAIGRKYSNPYTALSTGYMTGRALNEIFPLVWGWMFKAKAFHCWVRTGRNVTGYMTLFAFSNETPKDNFSQYFRRRVLTNPYLKLNGSSIALEEAWGISDCMFLPPLITVYRNGTPVLVKTTPYLFKPGSKITLGVVRVGHVAVDTGNTTYTVQYYVPGTFSEAYKKASNWDEYKSYFTGKPFWQFW